MRSLPRASAGSCPMRGSAEAAALGQSSTRTVPTCSCTTDRAGSATHALGAAGSRRTARHGRSGTGACTLSDPLSFNNVLLVSQRRLTLAAGPLPAPMLASGHSVPLPTGASASSGCPGLSREACGSLSTCDSESTASSRSAHEPSRRVTGPCSPQSPSPSVLSEGGGGGGGGRSTRDCGTGTQAGRPRGSIPRDSGSHGGGTVTGSSLTRGSCSFNKLVTCSGISRDPDSGGTGSRAPDSGQLPLQFQVQQVCDLQRQQ